MPTETETDDETRWAAKVDESRRILAIDEGHRLANARNCGCDYCFALVAGRPTQWLARHSWEPPRHSR